MTQQTPLYENHQKQGAVMVDFAGWAMPLHYGSQLDEHQQVRKDVGMFDVSHMGIIDINGIEASAFLRRLLANNIDKLTPGQALYSCMLNHEGGVVDDLIVYCISADFFRLVVNAATAKKDLQWMQLNQSPFSVVITQHLDFAIIAIQGPNAREKVSQVLPEFKTHIASVKKFHFFMDSSNFGAPHSSDTEGRWLVARTGYTGEDGLEIILPAGKAAALWQAFANNGIPPIGLGARDTLRLEAGLNLYGQDMDESVTPLVSNLGWTVAFEPPSRLFIGRRALEAQRDQGVSEKLVGLVLLDKGVLRHDQSVLDQNQTVGKVTSGSFSPTLKQAIGLARIYGNVERECAVLIRHKSLRAQIVQPPFVRSKS